MFGQHPLTELIPLNLPAAFHPGPLQSEINPANAGEQAAEPHAATPTLPAFVLVK